jgi:hypothetical protein
MEAQRLAVSRASPLALCALLAACIGPNSARSPTLLNSEPSERAFQSAVEVGAPRELSACSRLVFGPEGTLFTSDSENVLRLNWSLAEPPELFTSVSILGAWSANPDVVLTFALLPRARQTAPARLALGAPFAPDSFAQPPAGCSGIEVFETPTRRGQWRRTLDSGLGRSVAASFDLGSDRDGDGQRDPQRAGSVHWLELASGRRLASVSPHGAASSFGRELAVCTARDVRAAEQSGEAPEICGEVSNQPTSSCSEGTS